MSGTLAPTAAFFMNPQAFCEANFIYPGALGDEDGVFWVGLNPFATLSAGGSTQVKATRKGKAIPCYTLAKRPDENDAFQAYWCPYKHNGIGGVAVGRSAKFFFTVQLNGCSLGLGNEAPDGSRLVRHVNLANTGPASGDTLASIPGKQDQQAQAQRIALRQEGDFGNRIVQPGDYRTADKNKILTGEANVFGVFAGGHWVVKALKYRTVKTPGLWTFEHKGVKEIFEG
jgi:hypothetical protein